MRLLAIDTSLELCSAALVFGSGRGAVRSEDLTRGHAERLFSMIDELLAEEGETLACVDRIVVSIGPGSFTGIRVGLAAARGFGLALGKPVVGISTLAALARSYEEPPGGPVVAAIDARKGEVYLAVYAEDGAELAAPIAVSIESAVDHVPQNARLIVGSGAPLLGHAATCAGRRLPPLLPLAGPDILSLARLGADAPVQESPPVPLYVRPPDAKPQKRAALVSAGPISVGDR
ncbi:UGMP family protein [Hartmannibacter diazotrophicus]|uniref:UGMP family protein n=1 Tax=Hartmannibacter diazotrophicus TaxID=1482074 RepID=A0A2C9DDG0_9HYPH|nr:tRNA (adenosine(37)-N6)-threonylcarbamoyltransferase complex dimerization subunit type 1 TsaB [Hartmannibacter diazotrophicus]SON58199.1 UGMP family protein [Hartmannibacter diazotrophicus]